MIHRGINLEHLRSAMQLPSSASDMLWALVANSRIQKFAVGEEAVLRASLTPYWPIVVTGRVRVYMENATGQQITLYYAYRGECCTLSATSLDNANAMPIKTEVVAESVLLMIPAGRLREWTHRRHWAEYQARMSAMRLHAMTEHISRLTSNTRAHQSFDVMGAG